MLREVNSQALRKVRQQVDRPQAPTLDEIRQWPSTVDLLTAGRALGISRTKTYELARAGQFPVRLLPLGKRYRVAQADLLRALGLAESA